MNETASVRRVDTDGLRSRLGELLEEYHGWMENRVRHETDASYDAETSVAEDLRDVASSETACRAWLAFREESDVAGCGLLYGIADETVELKRLYVRPSSRRKAVGRTLAESLIDAATERGYTTLALTTPPWSHAAHTLYDALGFERTGPYPETRLPERYHDGAMFMQLDLTV